MGTRLDSHIAATLMVVAILGCGKDGARFGSGSKIMAVNVQEANATARDTEGANSYRYVLEVAKGAPVVAPGPLATTPGIFHADNGVPLTEEELTNWTVSLQIVGQEPLASGPIVTGSLDASNYSGMVNVQAHFKEVNGARQGVAYTSFFVDAEKPKVMLQRLENIAGSTNTKVFWVASDNFRINPDRTGLIACKSIVPDFAPKSFAQALRLPDSCNLVLYGVDLLSRPSTLEMDMVTIGDSSIEAANAEFALFTEDMVEGFDFTWVQDPAENASQLLLTTTPTSIIYTAKESFDVNSALRFIQGKIVRQIDELPGLWPGYRMTVVPSGSTTAALETDFQKKVSVPLSVTADGRYAYTVQVQESSAQIKSNRQEVVVVRDTTSPVVFGVQVSVLEGILTPASRVTVNWTAMDANGVSRQNIAIRLTGDKLFSPLGSIEGGQGSFSFTWGTRPAKGFEIQITAVDPAGNIGVGQSQKWAPQVFNAALLTSSVRCLFCHIKVDGDLGGIDFPAATHVGTGQNFEVTSKIYGTNTVPSKLATTAKGGSNSNYKNSPLVMFPINGQWPSLTGNILRPRMNGTLRVGSIFVTRTHQGNLVLGGTDESPIVLNGEVFIDGDVVIKGSYRGVGTIYAQNIYIVDDIKALKSPFPFDADPVKAVAQAQASIAKKDDALYLGALKQVLIGNYITTMGDSCGPEGASIQCVTDNPFGWLPKAEFVKLGRKATLLKDVNGFQHELKNAHFNPGTDDRAQIEVNRVDAFIYAQKNLAWRSYANILLNGGYMAPYSGVVATAPYRIYHHVENKRNWVPNPRNGLPVTQSVIRYDYRLRVGGAGFETLKSYFEQN